nr:PREDICTED: basic proline-rich protein-like [Equus przewalskii]
MTSDVKHATLPDDLPISVYPSAARPGSRGRRRPPTPGPPARRPPPPGPPAPAKGAGPARPASEGLREPPGLPAYQPRGLDSLPGPLTWTPGLAPRPGQPGRSRPAHGETREARPRLGAGARPPGRPTPGRAPADARRRRPGLEGARTALGPGRAVASPAEQDGPAAAARSVPASRLPRPAAASEVKDWGRSSSRREQRLRLPRSTPRGWLEVS